MSDVDDINEMEATGALARHANRTPETLTAAEIALAQQRATTLYPGQLLSHSGDQEDERHLRVAIVEAEILVNPSLNPLASAGEALEAGPALAANPADPLALDLAELVTAYRRRQGLSQRELAERLGMKQPHIARLEAGLHTPSVDTLVRVARALGASLRIDVSPDGARLATAEPAA